MEKNIDKKISENIKKIVREKHKTGTACAKVLGISSRAFNDSINNIKGNQYPSVKYLKRIAKACDCNITDFFKVD